MPGSTSLALSQISSALRCAPDSANRRHTCARCGVTRIPGLLAVWRRYPCSCQLLAETRGWRKLVRTGLAHLSSRVHNGPAPLTMTVERSGFWVARLGTEPRDFGRHIANGWLVTKCESVRYGRSLVGPTTSTSNWMPAPGRRSRKRSRL